MFVNCVAEYIGIGCILRSQQTAIMIYSGNMETTEQNIRCICQKRHVPASNSNYCSRLVHVYDGYVCRVNDCTSAAGRVKPWLVGGRGVGEAGLLEFVQVASGSSP